MPGPWRPIESSIPDDVSAIRGVPRPDRGAARTNLVTNAPRLDTSKNRCSSLPFAAHPDAVISGLAEPRAGRGCGAVSTISDRSPSATRPHHPEPRP